MPRGFEIFGRGHDLWSALPWDPSNRNHKATFSLGLARLARGVTPEAATRELVDLTPAMRKDLGKANDWGQTLRVQSLQESITGDVRPALLILLGAVGLILMLAAVNLGTLVLGRSIERVGEMALRTALGASRGRLVRQIVIEQAVLATAGAIAGIAVAYLVMPILIARIPAEVPRLGEIALDWTVLMSVLAGSVSVAMVVALLPAVITARPNLQPLLRQSRTTDTPGAPPRARRARGRADWPRRGTRDRIDADAAIDVEPAARRSRLRPEQRPHLPAADHVEVSRHDEGRAVLAADHRSREGAARRDRCRARRAPADERLLVDDVRSGAPIGRWSPASRRRASAGVSFTATISRRCAFR